jgi:HAE1 family hydrophobic/amphiphilic exporter-1
VFVVPPPSIPGLGISGGSNLELLSETGGDLQQELDALQKAAEAIVDAGNQEPALRNVQTTFRAGVPQKFVEVDRVKAATMGVPLQDVFQTMQGYLGSFYANDFNKFNQTYQVRIQADHEYRLKLADLRALQVRNSQGDMVPLGTLIDVHESFGPQVVSRYNLYPSAMVMGMAQTGYSSGEAMQVLERLADENLPYGMSYQWTGVSYQEAHTGNEAVIVFGLAVLLVYLVLAAQYESWSSPMAVILVVPLALLGSAVAISILPFGIDVYAQIGLILVIALASKNAILIVEFARDLHAQGRPIAESAIEAARMRFRPILMTSFAFILGVLPLVVSTGAGASSRISLGSTVLGGMITSTFLAVLFVPTFYVVMQRASEWWSKDKNLKSIPVEDSPE